ncbi:MAG: HNH endonuclease [Chloroflexi bacterium]|nr:HNH endonuclease [Chloroflexota bacterium]
MTSALTEDRRARVSISVLVLNQNYEPLNVCDFRRAFVLVSRGKAEVLEHADGATVRTPSRLVPLPSVIRLIYYIRRPQPKAKLTRRDVFQRDRWTCQYCGVRTRDLTLDHVVPRHRGGKHVWDNLVSACKLCNHRKGGRSPEQARMTLLRRPGEPRVTVYYLFAQHLRANEAWHKFVPEWRVDEVAAI